jgi:hypothetical protein
MIELAGLCRSMSTKDALVYASTGLRKIVCCIARRIALLYHIFDHLFSVHTVLWSYSRIAELIARSAIRIRRRVPAASALSYLARSAQLLCCRAAINFVQTAARGDGIVSYGWRLMNAMLGGERFPTIPRLHTARPPTLYSSVSLSPAVVASSGKTSVKLVPSCGVL